MKSGRARHRRRSRVAAADAPDGAVATHCSSATILGPAQMVLCTSGTITMSSHEVLAGWHPTSAIRTRWQTSRAIKVRCDPPARMWFLGRVVCRIGRTFW